ncbi:protein strawberry notch homolog 1 [Exaiptasia diaphana]|uniref:Uncharacterized protein n=1 Tax=Exaiptasia diaphana TaxID=2652724 RepID=A0A913X6G8_EXADI|nr:protein strawberry notch homolog 1 [Exaiptasia diaphana]KXJ14796.1 Protein strawberry notch-like 1 [Exaiptasia diaphana]
MADTGQENSSSFAGIDLLSEALGESGLNLEEHFDFFENAPATTLSSFAGLDYLGVLDNLTSTLPNTTPTTLQNSSIVEHVPAGQNIVGTEDLFSRVQPISTLSGVVQSQPNVVFSQPSLALSSEVPSSATRVLQQLLSQNSLDSRSQRTALSSSSPLMIDLASTSNQIHSNQLSWPGSSPSRSALFSQNISDQKRELSKKDVSRLWSNDIIMMTKKNEAKMENDLSVEPEEEEEDEDLGYTDTYAEYMPTKLSFGKRHPDPVVETSSLASVSPPNIWYRLQLPQDVIDSAHLSALQLEAVVYACQKHETFLPNGNRAGFLIGDGAGVGKGRIVAGIIYENYLLGRKRAIWFSVSNDLKHDAYRDLKDIGCNIHVNSLNKFKYDVKLSSKSLGGIKKGVIFATYSSLIGESQSTGKYNTRLKQLLHWCGSDYEGVIILDECHKAKNLVPTGSSKPTKTGLAVLTLQNSLPKARVVYCSATGASEPKNMAYMSRLGIWGIGTPFREFNDFIQAVERRGVGAMEIVAMDMKLRGMYMARQLSFAGVGFDIKDVCLSEEFIQMYDAAVQLWVDAREKFEKAADMMDADSKLKKTMWGQFWSAHQRFFKYLCIASKVKAVVEIAQRAIAMGKCVVIGLQSTGEARTLEQLEESGGELTDFVSTAKGVFQTLVDKHFPAPDRKKMAGLLGLVRDTDSNGSRSAVSSPVPKRKRKNFKKAKPPKKLKTGLERIFDLSSDSDSDSNEASNDENKGTNDSLESVESDNNEQSSGNESEEEEEDDFNPFGGFGSDQEDPWLNRKTKKKSKSKSNRASPDTSDPAMSALAAAGLNVSTPIWNSSIKPSKTFNGLPDLLPARTSSPTSFGSKNLLQKAQLNMHHSQSAPVLSSLLQSSTGSPTQGSASDQCCAMKKELLEKVEVLSKQLPPNTLDELIDSLGGPDKVSEMTGRKGRVVSHDDGTVSYESRSRQDVSLEYLNIEEKKRFMCGEKFVAIISEAASSGISLQADRRAQNQRRRVHITLELPWSADKAIQQFGRSHRSNQVSAPEYIFLISELAGERRFASVVAKRLESLGALTHGDRRATESRDLSRYNFDNKYGRAALEAVLKSICGHATPMVPPPSNYSGNFINDIRVALVGVGLATRDDRGIYNILDKDYTNLSRFLNRILGISVQLQNLLFGYFMDTLAAIILQAKRSGRWDEGILDLGSQGEEVTELSVQTFVGSKTIGTATTELHTVSVERGASWEHVFNLSLDQTDPNEGFYVSHTVRNDKRTAIFVVCQKKKMYGIYRPNTGLQTKHESIQDIKKKYKKVTSIEAKPFWQAQYESSFSQCSHAYWKGNCKKATVGLTCEVGLRRRSFNILSGSVLSVWSKVESVLAGQPGHNSKVQIIRCKRSDGGKIVGCLIPSNCVPALARALSPSEDGQTETIEIL